MTTGQNPSRAVDASEMLYSMALVYKAYESLLEAAPQILLQLVIIFRGNEPGIFKQKI